MGANLSRTVLGNLFHPLLATPFVGPQFGLILANVQISREAAVHPFGMLFNAGKSVAPFVRPQFGLILAKGLDAVEWRRVSAELPEIIPRGVNMLWERYY